MFLKYDTEYYHNHRTWLWLYSQIIEQYKAQWSITEGFIEACEVHGGLQGVSEEKLVVSYLPDDYLSILIYGRRITLPHSPGSLMPWIHSINLMVLKGTESNRSTNLNMAEGVSYKIRIRSEGFDGVSAAFNTIQIVQWERLQSQLTIIIHGLVMAIL